MNAMLTDEELTRLLGETALSFEVPAEGPEDVLDELGDRPAAPFLRRRSVRLGAAAAALVAGVLVVQALAGGATPSSRTELADAAKAPAVPGSAEGGAMGSGGTTGGTTGGASGEVTRSPAGSVADPGQLAPAAAPQVTGFTSSGTASSPGEQAAPPVAAPDAFEDSARIVKTGTIGLVVGDGKVSTVVGQVRRVTTTVGGYLAEEKSQEYGDDPTSTLTLRVPVKAFERTVQAVRDQVKNGIGKVDSATVSGQDVTAQYADLQAQITSLTAARNRFLTILSRADTIGETLSVQQRVDSTQLQIDRLEGQRRLLANQSDLATLTVTVSEKPKSVEATRAPSGLSRAWDDATHGFTSGVEGLIARSGRALLVLLVAVAALAVLRLGWRVARRRLV